MPDVEVPNPDDLAELKERSFSRRVALTAVMYAVVLSVSALGGNNAGKEMLLAQQQASNQWAYYQAKASREHQYRIQKLLLEVQIEERGPSMSEAARVRYGSLLERFAQEESRYAGEKKEIEESARVLEKQRDENLARDPYFDYAEVMLQIAIVMATLAVLSGVSAAYWFSTVLGFIGALLTVNGYTLWVKLPFLS